MNVTAFTLKDKVLMVGWKQDWREFFFVEKGLDQLKVSRQVLGVTGIGLLISDRSL